MALNLHPDTRRVFIVSGAMEGKDAFEKQAREELKGYPTKAEITYLTDLKPGDLVTQASHFPDKSIVIFLWQQVHTGSGEYVGAVELLRMLSAASRVPVYGVASGYMGAGIVGGSFSTPHDWGTRVAEIALRIADGTPAKQIPIESARNMAVFDWRQLRRWGISERMLPPGSEVQFRQLTAWDRYKWQIIGMVVFCLLQFALTAKLLVEWRSRRKAGEALAELNRELQKNMEEIRALNGRLLSAQEVERRRIAMELHDDLSQQVAALGIRLSIIKRKLASVDSAQDSIAAVEGGLMRLASSIHSLSHELHPALLERAGLAPALKAHCEECEEVNNIKVHLAVDIQRAVPSDVALCLYRISQETLRNVVKHSGAREAWVSLRDSGNHLHLSVEDGGKGFDPNASAGKGLGLVSMKERVRMVGGTFEIQSRHGGGAITRVAVPVPPLA
jgi:signal transduction histidine kinase